MPAVSVNLQNHPALIEYQNGPLANGEPSQKRWPNVPEFSKNEAGEIVITSGEVFCRFRKADGQLCDNDTKFSSTSNLKTHVRTHGTPLATVHRGSSSRGERQAAIDVWQKRVAYLKGTSTEWPDDHAKTAEGQFLYGRVSRSQQAATQDDDDNDNDESDELEPGSPVNEVDEAAITFDSLSAVPLYKATRKDKYKKGDVQWTQVMKPLGLAPGQKCSGCHDEDREECPPETIVEGCAVWKYWIDKSME